MASVFSGELVLELYPDTGSPDSRTRVGFVVADLAAALDRVLEHGGLVRERDDAAGRAVVYDPDGRAVELSGAVLADEVNAVADEHGSLAELLASVAQARPDLELGTIYLATATCLRALLLSGKVRLVRQREGHTDEELLPGDAIAALRRPGSWHPSEHDLRGFSTIELRPQ